MSDTDPKPQVLRYSPLPDRAMHRLSVYRAVQWIGFFGSGIAGQFVPALIAWIGALIVDVPAIWILNQLGFHELALDTTAVAVSYAIAGVVWLAVIVLCMLVVSAFKASTRRRELGEWHGVRFVYRQPVTITSTLATPADNERMLRIVVRDAPRLSIVYCRLVSPNSSALLQATLQSPFFAIKNWRYFMANRTWPTFADGPLSVAVRIGRARECYLEWWLPENAVAHHLTVEMLSFKIPNHGDSNPQNDFSLHVSQPSNGYDFYGRGP